MTKAEIKRQTGLRNSLTSLLTRTLIDFQDRCLGASVKWGIKTIEVELKQLKEEHGRKKESRMWGDRISTTVIDNSYSIKKLEERLSRKNILTLGFISDAKKNYDDKFDRLVEKLVSYNIDTRHLKVEQICSQRNELSFLITNDEVEVHARLIFVDGVLVAPHYRFITTIRNKEQ